MADANQQVLMSMLKVVLTAMSNSNKAFYRQYGKDALPVIAGVMDQTGADWGKIMQQMSADRTMQSVAQLWLAGGAAMGMGTEIVNVSDRSMHYRQSHCALGLEGTTRELCEAVMNIDRRRVSTFLGQEIDMNILKTKAAGDDQCEVIFSTK